MNYFDIDTQLTEPVAAQALLVAHLFTAYTRSLGAWRFVGLSVKPWHGSTTIKTLRIVQWATGSIGQIAIRHFVDNPIYDLVGVHVTNPDKIGCDAGDLAGTSQTGIAATSEIGAIIGLKPDCVHYAPLHPDIEDICRLLRAGINVVTPAGYVFPTPSTADDFQLLRSACSDGGSSFHGTGVHPGFAGDLLPITLCRLMTRLDQVQVRETADFRLHPSAAMMKSLGFGADADKIADQQYGLLKMMETAYEPSLRMIGAALGVEIDRISLDFDTAIAKRDLNLRRGKVRRGTVGGMRFEWNAWVGDRSLVVFHTFWKVDDDLEPDWGYGSIKYHMAIKGDPPLELNFESAFKHPAGDEGYWGRVWTAMNGVNAIPAVVKAKSGVLTQLDLGVIQPVGLVRPRTDNFGEPQVG